MEFPFQNCIVSAESFSASRVREVLDYSQSMTYKLLDLSRLESELQMLGAEKVLAQYLTAPERVYLEKLTLEKRKREWLGGRFAAKFAAAGVLGLPANEPFLASIAVIADENGRPFLAAAQQHLSLPDISISHSGDLAAGLAVGSGLCGVDIQKVTDRVVKVRQRFCTPDEEHFISKFYSPSRETQRLALTKLWAAKEAVRKTANKRSLPGFLELALTDINEVKLHRGASFWRFILQWHHNDRHGKQAREKCFVAVGLLADYALALTSRSDTLG